MAESSLKGTGEEALEQVPDSTLPKQNCGTIEMISEQTNLSPSVIPGPVSSAKASPDASLSEGEVATEEVGVIGSELGSPLVTEKDVKEIDMEGGRSILAAGEVAVEKDVINNTSGMLNTESSVPESSELGN